MASPGKASAETYKAHAANYWPSRLEPTEEELYLDSLLNAAVTKLKNNRRPVAPAKAFTPIPEVAPVAETPVAEQISAASTATGPAPATKPIPTPLKASDLIKSAPEIHGSIKPDINIKDIVPATPQKPDKVRGKASMFNEMFDSIEKEAQGDKDAALSVKQNEKAKEFDKIDGVSIPSYRSSTWTCPTCGKNIPEGCKFCPECGLDLRTVAR